MALTFANLEELNRFSQKLLRIADTNTDLRYIEDSDDLTFAGEGRKLLSYIKNISDIEDLKNGRNYRGPAHRLHEALDACINAYVMLTDPTGDNFNIRKNNMASAAAIIKDLTNPEKANNLTDLLNSYYLEYGYTEAARPELQRINAIFNSVTSMGQMIRFEERSRRVGELNSELRDLALMDRAHKNEVEKLVNAANKAGIMFYQIDLNHGMQHSKVKALDTVINNLEDKAKQQEIRAKIDTDLNEVNEQIKPYDDAIAKAQAELHNITKFADEMELRSMELDVAERSVFAINVTVADKESQIDNLNSRIEQEKIPASDLDPAKNELKALLSKGNTKELIETHLILTDRISKLESAVQTMNRLVDEDVNIFDILDKSNNGKKLDLLTSRDKENLDAYLEAKNNIISSYSSDKKNSEAGALFEKLEKDRTQPLPLSFVLRTASSMPTQIMNIKMDMDESLAGNKDILNQYKELNSRILKAETSANNIKALDTQKKQLESEIVTIQKDKAANEKTLSAFCSKAAKSLKLDINKVNDLEKIRTYLSKKTAELNKEIAAVTESKPYYTLKSQKNKLERLKVEHSKNGIKEQIIQRKSEREYENTRFQVVDKLKNKQEVLKKQALDMVELRAQIHDDYADLKNGTALNSVYDRISHIYHHILDMPKDPKNIKKSPTFTALYNKLGAVYGNMQNPEVTNEAKVAMIKEMATAAKNYLDEKDTQWRPRIFASNQRFVRITFAKELLNLKDTAIDLVNRNDEMEKVAYMFVKARVSRNIPDPVAHLESEMHEAADRLREKNQYIQPTNEFNKATEITENMKEVLTMKL